jgi:hypothetical protein
MATGPEHYQRAEQILAEVRKAQASMASTPRPETIAQQLAEAQIHATLALAAATALRVPNPEVTFLDDGAWMAVASNATRPEEPHYRHKTLPRWEDRSGMCVKCGADSADGSCVVPDEPEGE